MQVIAATGNQGKLREFERILAPYGFTVIGMKDAGLDIEIEENGTTFAENAKIKAQAVHRLTGKAVISDDSGLCVDALNGRPGVYSARYGGADLPHEQKIVKLLGELEQVPPERRGAQYVCAIHFILPDSQELALTAECPGRIGWECQGENGFGYDPIFYVGEYSMAHLSNEEKDRLSHRGKALRMLAEAMQELERSGRLEELRG